MNSVQESKNELDAAIRYAENAISSAKQTIESMEFRQEMAKKQYSEQTGREEALQREVANLNERLKMSEDEVADLKVQRDKARLDKVCAPTMPVIPKAVAIAIFREGVLNGVEAACAELEGKTIEIEENEYCGGFEVTFTKEIDLDDELDLDWMRGKVGDYGENFVLDCLSNLCADKEFACRIHGIDSFDQEEKKND